MHCSAAYLCGARSLALVSHNPYLLTYLLTYLLACDHKAIDTKLYCVAVAADAGGCEGANSGAPAGGGGGTGQRGEGGETLLTRCELPPCTHPAQCITHIHTYAYTYAYASAAHATCMSTALCVHHRTRAVHATHVHAHAHAHDT